MSEIYLPDMVHSMFLKIKSAKVYDLNESIAASKYPMQVVPEPKNVELTETATKLAQSAAGEGHDNTMRITTNYRQLKTIHKQRKTHRIPEWREFCEWIESLPHSELITGNTKRIVPEPLRAV